MEPASPARLYAAVAGALLVVLGIVGFFYDASFSLHDTQTALGVLEVNAWFNLLYVLTGAVGVLAAGASSRGYALAMGLLYTLLGIIGWGSEGLHFAVGLLGLAAVAGTPKSVGSKPRAQAARERA